VSALNHFASTSKFQPSCRSGMTDIASWLLAVLLLAGLMSLVLFFQDRFIYFPVRYPAAQIEEAIKVGAQEVKFQTGQGNQVAFYFRQEHSETAPEKLWLVFGGNGDVALEWLRLIRSFPGTAPGFLLIDYPGYGICEGRPNPQTIRESSECALQALLEQKRWKLGADTLCVLGHSLGGAAALQFAATHPVREILVISTFTTMDDMVRAQIHIPLGRLLRHRFDNKASLKAILSRQWIPEIYILHGQADEIIPPKMGRALAQMDSSRINYAEIPGAHHNDIIQKALPLILQRLK
jgi:pimeloyl-ACP methyl ester carboxylesterase